jgi:hypothetical protein
VKEHDLTVVLELGENAETLFVGHKVADQENKVEILLYPLNSQFEENFLFGHLQIFHLLDVLGFNGAQVNKELVVVEHEAFLAANLGDKVVDIVKVDRIPHVLVIYHHECPLTKFGD